MEPGEAINSQSQLIFILFSRCAIRDSAHEKLLPLLQDAVPEVRAATAFALGTFVRSGGKGERSEHANSIDHSVTLRLVGAVQAEASPLVRKEVPPPFAFALAKKRKLGRRRDKDGRNWATNRRRDRNPSENPVEHVQISERHKNQFKSVETGRRFDFVSLFLMNVDQQWPGTERKRLPSSISRVIPIFFADRSGAAVGGAHLRFHFHPGEKSRPNFTFHS